MKLSLLLVLSLIAASASAQLATIKITSDASPAYHLILERTFEEVSLQFCRTGEATCTLIGNDTISLMDLDGAIWETRDQGDYPLLGAALGASAGPVVIMSCVLFKKCISALRALGPDKRSILLASSPMAGAAVGGLAGFLIKEKAIDKNFVDTILRGNDGELKVEDSLDSIVENYSMLMIQLQNRK